MQFHNPFRLGGDVFDPSHRFETSWLLTPWVLFGFRALFSLYAFTVLIFNLIWYATSASHGGSVAAQQSFSYFTILTYWGLAFYFLASATHTFFYARHGTPLLNRLPRPLQALHSLYYSSVICYPILVTIIFWGVLFQAWWPSTWEQWSNVSQHAMNSLFAIFEIVIPRTNAPPFIHAFWLVIILALYLSVAYITQATQGFYVYSFLDPKDGNARVAAYVIGIAVAILVIFVIVRYLVVLRKLVTERKMGREGRFHGGRSMQQGDVELEAVRIWEK